MDIATGMTHPLRKRFVAPSKAVAQSVVELLVDSKPVGIGTIVDADGWILTKASVLGGKVSCRLPGGSVVAAEERAESQEHDLALLKIDVGGLSAAAVFRQGAAFHRTGPVCGWPRSSSKAGNRVNRNLRDPTRTALEG